MTMENTEIPAINRRIKEIRLVLKLSQTKFSAMTALSAGYLSRIEAGQKKANDRLIKLVCSAFSVNETYLRYGEGQPFTDIPDEKFMNLVNNFRSLPLKYQDFLFKMFDMFLEMKDTR
jgi:transcriptional regulator with XRE-family HTH domain